MQSEVIVKVIQWILVLVTGLSGAALLIAGLNNYPGSKPIYILFSAIFWLMLLTAFGKRTHYGYLFLAIALWLGFWGKITAHLIFKYPYVEPVGQFDGSATAWDSVLWVAILASAGVMLGKLLFTLMGKKYSRVVSIDQAKVPLWYPVIRKWIWLFSLTGIVGVAVMNMILGIQQIGLVPRTILPWPLNALIAWQVSIGSALLLTVLLWWEVSLKKSISVSIYALLIEAGISTASLLSRGAYIFHALPQFFALFENRKWLVGVSKIKVVAIVLVSAGLMVIFIAGVTTFRAYLYPHAGGFTTEDQKRLTRLEVLEGGIARVKKLIAQGEPQEGHLRELLVEKAQIEDQRRLARLEVLEGGIANVKKLIFQGEPQEGHLRDLLAEKAQLEKSLSKEGVQTESLREFNAEKAQLVEMLSTNKAKSDLVVAGVDTKHEELLQEAKNKPKSDVVVADDIKNKVKSVAGAASSFDSLLDNKNKIINEVYYQSSTGFVPRILALAVDRWIGLEGVMAVSAYPEKNSALLFDAAKEKREIGKTTKFQEISNSHYRWTDAGKWQFASLPGAAAFLYFSGSLWVVVLGMALFSFLLQLAEQLVFSLTSNPLLCSLFGLTLANTIAQFGIAPRQDIPFYSMILGFVLLVSFAQSDKVYAVIRKFVFHRDDRGAV